MQANRRRQIPALLLLWPLLTLGCCTAAVQAETLVQCSGRWESQLCIVTAGPLNGSCPVGAKSLGLKFNGPEASWPADGSGGGGLRDCESVRHLKVTGWTGPQLASGHLRQLTAVTSADIVDGSLESVDARACTNSLVDLSLARNQISSLHEQSLADCGSLISLDLSDNRISSLPDRWLASCRSLRTLKLSGNRLAELRPGALLGAADLREFLAQKNQFQMLHNIERSFINNPRLNLIDLRNNGLFSYQAGRLGFCGPENVTVRMHFSGCPPPAQRAAVPICATAGPAVPTAATTTQATTATTPDFQSLLLRSLGILPEGVWVLYTLAATLAITLAVLAASLCVCHRLKLRLARLKASGSEYLLAGNAPSLRNFHTLYSQSALSGGRRTPSGRDQSSHCPGEGASQCCDEPPYCEQQLMEMQRMLTRNRNDSLSAAT